MRVTTTVFLMLFALVGRAALGRSSDAPARPALSAHLSGWLIHDSSGFRRAHLAPGVRVRARALSLLEADLGYQFAYGAVGTHALKLASSLHAATLRAHLVLGAPVSLLVGAGPALTMVTSQAWTPKASEPLSVSLVAGGTAAIGVETRALSLPIRFEGAVLTRGDRLDLLAGLGVGLP